MFPFSFQFKIIFKLDVSFTNTMGLRLKIDHRVKYREEYPINRKLVEGFS